MRSTVRIAAVAAALLAAAAGARAQTGGRLLYREPAGWKRFAHEGVVFFVPPTLRKGENCVLTVLPDQRIAAQPPAWFRDSMDGALKGLRVVQRDRTFGSRVRDGYEMLMSGAITEGAGGTRLYWFFAARTHGARGAMVSLSASSPELFRRYRPDLSRFMASLVLVGVTASDPPPP